MRVVVFLLLVLAVFSGCRKDKDTEAPSIEISSPTAGAAYSAGDLIEVRATVTDNRQLDNVSLTLLGSGLNPVHTTTSKNLDGTSFTLEESYSLEGFDDPSGTYQLRVQASDGEQTANEYVAVYVEAIPLERVAILAAVELGTETGIKAIEAGQAVRDVATLASDFSGIGVDHDAQLVAVAGAVTPEIRGIDVASGATDWTVSMASNSPFERFTGLTTLQQQQYVGDRTGWLRAYDYNGDVQLTSGMTDTYFPQQWFLYSDYLLVAERASGSNTMRLGVYWKFSGEIAQSLDLPFDEVVGFAVLGPNQVLIIGNEGNAPKVMAYHTVDNDLLTIDDLPDEEIRCVAEISAGNVVYGTDADLYWYSYDNSSVLSFNTQEGAAALKLDAFSNELLAASGSRVRVFDPLTRAFLYEVELASPVLGLEVLYNRVP